MIGDFLIMKNRLFVSLVVLLSFVLFVSVSCSTSTETSDSPVKELSLEEQYYMGKATTGMIFKNYPYLENAEANEYLRLIGMTISTFTNMNDDIYTNYSFALLDTDDLVAFASPKGFITISKGLFKACSNEDELASIVALMIGLNMSNYPIESLPCKYLRNIRDAISKEDKDLLDKAFMEAVEYLYNTSKSDYPTEDIIYSDREAIRMLHKVGYSSASYKTILQKLSDQKVNDRFNISIEGRSEALDKVLDESGPAFPLQDERTKRFLNILSTID